MGETLLQIAARHVIEGEQLIANQKALIAQLRRDGYDPFIPTADATLEKLEKEQLLSVQRYRDMLVKAEERPEEFD